MDSRIHESRPKLLIALSHVDVRILAQMTMGHAVRLLQDECEQTWLTIARRTFGLM
jgi:hypothetical protein